ncbi:MAG: hypothetical protein EKK31_04820 [Hyphomicrobiales bacterium]|jgi:hypothetical protein|nr:MAG: hypothetical protein EKK31_04820 [Hyphomicrobiales bacterium]
MPVDKEINLGNSDCDDLAKAPEGDRLNKYGLVRENEPVAIEPAKANGNEARSPETVAGLFRSESTVGEIRH